jgi:uncharacterized protein with GYD domain
MATYITVGSFTDQGIRGVRDTTKRAAAVKEAAKKAGVTMKEIYWTMGQFDVIGIFEAPDDASMSAVSLAIGAAGNIRGQTLRAYPREEMDAILRKMP